jgi:hypothetical protein
MAKKKISKIKKYHYKQNWGTYLNDTLVFVGYNANEVIKLLDKWEKTEYFISKINEELFNNNRGVVIFDNNRTLLWLKEFKDDWEFYEVLIHESHHLIFNVLGECRMMKDEIEAQAYQQEYLFREIRQKLQKVFKV